MKVQENYLLGGGGGFFFLVLIVEFSFLIWVSANTLVNRIGPPMPEQIVDESGKIVFTGDVVRQGQGVILKYALMDNGTLWGHGAYLGPDFSADYLHQTALQVQSALSQQYLGQPASALSPQQQSSLQGDVCVGEQCPTKGSPLVN